MKADESPIERALAVAPSQWIRVPMKHAAVINRQSLSEDTAPDYSFRYIDIGSVNSNGALGETAEFRFDNAPSRARRKAAKGDVLVSTVRTYLRAIAQIGEQSSDLVCSTGFATLSARSDILPRFLYWWCRSTPFVEEVVARSNGIVYPAISPSDLGTIPVVVPPLDVQGSIADLLDRETARIDALIEAKLMMRQRIANRLDAVTEHQFLNDWPRVPLRRAMLRIEQGWSPQCDSRAPEGSEWGVLKAGCVNGGEFRPDEAKALPPDVEPDLRYLVKEGDLLVSRANTTELLGSAAIARNVRARTLLCDKLYRMSLNERLSNAFFTTWMKTREARSQLEAEATGASNSMQNVGQDTIRNLRVPLPSQPAQGALIAVCEREHSRSAALSRSLLNQTDVLKERRQALITAAVSGEIAVPLG